MIPGMKEVRDNVLLSLGALALLALFLYLGQSGGWDFKLGLMVVVSFGAAVFFVWEAYMEARGFLRSKKEREQWNVPTQVALEMPYAKLEARFRRLTGSDEAVVKPDSLSWKTGALPIFRLPGWGNLTGWRFSGCVLPGIIPIRS